MSYYFAAAAAVGGFTLRDQEISTTGQDNLFASSTTTGYVTNVTAAGSYTITKLSCKLWKAGGSTPNGTIKMAIYNASGGVATTLIDDTDTRPAGDVTATAEGSANELEFTGISAALTGSTLYKVGVFFIGNTDGEYGILYSTVSGDIDIFDSGSFSDYLGPTARMQFKSWSTP